MADLWEVCVLRLDSEKLMVIYSPSGIIAYDEDEFIKKYDPSFSKPVWDQRVMRDDRKREEYDKKFDEMRSRFWGLFLSEGWEPYACTDEAQRTRMFFRRKYQG